MRCSSGCNVSLDRCIDIEREEEKKPWNIYLEMVKSIIVQCYGYVLIGDVAFEVGCVCVY